MKLDLVEINKLSPPSLWDLGVLSALITTLLGVIKAQICSGRSAHFYARMLAQHSHELRDKTRENLNMRIKAWVLQCPERTAWVRRIIGEVAIRRWRMNRLADFALTKAFGDWQGKWPNGFEHKDNKTGYEFTRRYRQLKRAYNWKFFALTKIINVERILYGQTRPDPKADAEVAEMRAAYYKLWGTDILDRQTKMWSQPRTARTLKPIRFTPYELEDMREETEADITEKIDAVEKIDAGEIYPPPKPKPKLEHQRDDEDEAEDKPP